MRSNKWTNGAGLKNGEIASTFTDEAYERERAETIEKILANAVEIIRLLKQARSAVNEYRSMNIELDGIITEESNE